MDYAVSYDLGATWHNTWNQTIANLSEQVPIYPNTAGITIFSIPKYGYVHVYALFCVQNLLIASFVHSGILNQEAQTVDNQGRIHVLNRENTSDTGTEQW